MKFAYTILWCPFVLMIFFIISCNNGNQGDKEQPLSSDVVKNPNTANGNSDTSMLPKFSFSEEIHNFGRIMEGEKVSYSFKFRNTGKSDLVITDAKGSCGCTVADYPKKPIPPKGEGTVDIKFNTDGQQGYKRKPITVIANTHPNSKVLVITAQVQKPEK